MMRKLLLSMSMMLLSAYWLAAQESFPINGIRDVRAGTYAFKNATIITNSGQRIEDGTLVIKQGKIVSVGQNVSVPSEAIQVDCKGKYIYPSFIDSFTDYGSSSPKQTNRGFNWGAPAQFTNNKPGAFGWNQAVHPEVRVVDQFSVDESAANGYRSNGFGTVFTHLNDGIVRGTGAVVTLANKKENLVVLKSQAAQVFSFDKGTSTQSYPTSLMGSIALIRQTYLDAKWYQNKPSTEGVNLSLDAFLANQSVPQIFVAPDKWAAVRADRIGDEFGVQYIIRGGENGYQRIDELSKTKASYILNLDFPVTPDVEDPNNARYVSLADMRHWELAATNPAAFEKAKINFALTQDMKDSKSFLNNLRKAVTYGLSESKALEALTKTPAQLLGIYDQVGSLEAGKLANFIITSEPIFSSKAKILENWVAGEKYVISSNEWNNLAGKYAIQLAGSENYAIEISKDLSLKVIGKDTLSGKAAYSNGLVTLSFPVKKGNAAQVRLSGSMIGNLLSGTGLTENGTMVTWTGTFQGAVEEKKSADEKKENTSLVSKITIPFAGYGNEELPKQETILIKNATVWTNEKEGVLANTDVLLKGGKIAKFGKNLTEQGARVIDGTGKHVTPGIIDEHSHIAALSINEGAQSVTSEVRIGDNLDPEDIDIYRQLSGGVTTSHILHGSANTIGGQTQLIKLRWGTTDEGLKFQGADPFIKFALGENVKRTTSFSNNRYPDTRMGVEEVLTDAFDRAMEYDKAMKANPLTTRRDLELDALVEIMNQKRFITCHSYVQPEITYTMRVVEKLKSKGYNFNINTFTHILEGYKVADKMKQHGASASTFSDWYMYKTEVQDAIAYNAAIMHKMGLNVCINSDDAEMARRLNQEAAKVVKYGGVSEEDALKMVTLNPAKALHVDQRVGSLKPGKDADVVVWTDHPLSIYAKSAYTIVDGTVYFDREKDAQQRVKIAEEKTKLMQKMLADKKSGSPTQMAKPSMKATLKCADHDDDQEEIIVETQTIQ